MLLSALMRIAGQSNQLRLLACVLGSGAGCRLLIPHGPLVHRVSRCGHAEAASRKRRLLKGPEEFREVRVDHENET